MPAPQERPVLLPFLAWLLRPWRGHQPGQPLPVRVLHTRNHDVLVTETDFGWKLEFQDLQPRPPAAA